MKEVVSHADLDEKFALCLSGRKFKVAKKILHEVLIHGSNLRWEHVQKTFTRPCGKDRKATFPYINRVLR